MDIIQFVEQILGIQLLPYQKEMLKMLAQSEKIYYVLYAHAQVCKNYIESEDE